MKKLKRPRTIKPGSMWFFNAGYYVSIRIVCTKKAEGLWSDVDGWLELMHAIGDKPLDEFEYLGNLFTGDYLEADGPA